jgi:hypothetical protein
MKTGEFLIKYVTIFKIFLMFLKHRCIIKVTSLQDLTKKWKLLQVDTFYEPVVWIRINNYYGAAYFKQLPLYITLLYLNFSLT